MLMVNCLSKIVKIKRGEKIGKASPIRNIKHVRVAKSKKMRSAI